jgi:hypothetical protein
VEQKLRAPSWIVSKNEESIYSLIDTTVPELYESKAIVVNPRWLATKSGKPFATIYMTCLHNKKTSVIVTM